MQNEFLTVPCPRCYKNVIWNEFIPWRPFCSKRCQLIDLGEWVIEDKRIFSKCNKINSDD
ncbi:DNA gyrase inhibitor YacG [Pantoea sp. Nvir]|uniref:DNA gyrase inhibitor YacG n=1 Tax=Pantoea sp. Nvir TaxID=2576760 RepID=UPI0027E617BD|nr:DNA gyrase inhibitor YacG [Pantoea sp. Nvir]CAJ0991294.1 DNA gyrase inhibitor YacG [Pantoea sp. Nvir]